MLPSMFLHAAREFALLQVRRVQYQYHGWTAVSDYNIIIVYLLSVLYHVIQPNKWMPSSCREGSCQVLSALMVPTL